MKMPVVIAMVAVLGLAGGTLNPLAAQRTSPASPVAAAAGDIKSVLFNWMWYMGMLRGVEASVDTQNRPLMDT